jgi:GNAT superfamily N-acetyltransferase
VTKRATGFPERLSKYENSYTDCDALAESAMVATVEDKLVGVCFLSCREDSNVRAISLLAVDPEYQRFKVGRRLMESAIQLAKDEGATSIRLVVNAHSTTSFPLYASIGFSVKEPMSLVILPRGTVVPAPETIFEGHDTSKWIVRWLKSEDLPHCKTLGDRIVGHNRISDTEFFMELSAEDGYRPYRPWVLEIPSSSNPSGTEIAAYTSGCTWDNHSVAVSPTHWKFMVQHIMSHYFSPSYTDEQIEKAKEKGVEEEEPQILLPILSQPELFKWCLNMLRMRVEKNELLMSYGDYEYAKEPSGVYMPGVEY